MPTMATTQRCSVAGCRRKRHANERCHAHNMRAWKGWQVAGPVRAIRRLTAEQAAEIRRRYLSREAPTIVELAEEFRVSRVTIWHVLRGDRHRQRDGLQAQIDRRARDNEHPLARGAPT